MLKKNFMLEKDDFQGMILNKLYNENGYVIRDAKVHYDAGRAMDKELLINFIKMTQPKEYEKLEKIYGTEIEEPCPSSMFTKTDVTIINVIRNQIIHTSLINVIKHGVEFENGVSLKLSYKKNATDFNEEANRLYSLNTLSVMEEVYHKEGERIDLVIFLNGLAIFAFELKVDSQKVGKAIKQWITERDHSTALTSFKSGVLVAFAMDVNDVYMCTNLSAKEPFFMPFNRGKGKDGAGNPEVGEAGFKVEYMWEEILKKDSVMELLYDFIFIEKKRDKKTNKIIPNKGSIIFPRFQQQRAVRNILSDVKKNHTNRNYLIQHSAGSGKTNTIAWLSYRLAKLHDDDGNILIDTVVIVTDRIIVDSQLQDAVKGMEHEDGFIKTMDEGCTSEDLKIALEGNTKIIVTTIQKFLYIVQSVKDLSNKHFAILIDEAHSSTSGEYMSSVSASLSGKMAEEKDENGNSIEDDIDPTEDFVNEIIHKEIAAAKKPENVSFIAFTATPKSSTIQFFGTMGTDGKKTAFDLYSMKQALEEHFILDVLENYTTYDTYYEIKLKNNDPIVKEKIAKKELAFLTEVNEENISNKVKVIVEHFYNHMKDKLGGQAKGMIITSGRLAAVMYKKIMDDYLKKMGYTSLRTLVAFSGKVDKLKGDENTYTEVSMNNPGLIDGEKPAITEENLRDAFDTDDYKVLIVANKYQTGFSQDKLCAMYVDKKLSGISAVQTLSRLNRLCLPYQKHTFVLDFQNRYSEIEKAFEAYYGEIKLNRPSSVNDLERLNDQIDGFGFLDNDDINEFNEILYKTKGINKEPSDKQLGRMNALLSKAAAIINKPQNDIKERIKIRRAINNFNSFYLFLIQVTNLNNEQMHKKFNFLQNVVKKIEIPVEQGQYIADDVYFKFDMPTIAEVHHEDKTSPDLETSSEVNGAAPKEVQVHEDQKRKLSAIIAEINAAHGKNFDVDVVTKNAFQIRDLLMKDEGLKESAKNNTEQNFANAYNDSMKQALVNGYKQNKDFYKILLNDEKYRKEIMNVFIDEIYQMFNKKDDK